MNKMSFMEKCKNKIIKTMMGINTKISNIICDKINKDLSDSYSTTLMKKVQSLIISVMIKIKKCRYFLILPNKLYWFLGVKYILTINLQRVWPLN